MKIGYARVSTKEQDLTAQIKALKEHGCDKIYSEKVSGKNAQRVEFQKALEELQAGDMLIVTKLDRLARSTADATRLIKELFERAIGVHVINIGIIENTNTGRLLFNVMSAFAEFERDLIAERMAEGKEVARQDPAFKEGRPLKYSKHQLNHAMELLKTNSYTTVERLTGISKSTLIRESNRRKKTTES